MIHRTRIQDWKTLVLFEKNVFRSALAVINNGGYQVCLVISKAGKLIGIITDSDVRKALLKGVCLEDDISMVMNHSPMIISPEIDETKAHNLMNLNHIFHLPIVNQSNELVGLHVAEQLCIQPSREETLVIMAGGKGKRLMPLTKDIPKPMLPLHGKPLLEHIVIKAKDDGFKNIMISVNYLSNKIKDYFQDGSKFGVEIDYLEEEKPLGTAGAISALINSNLKNPIVVTNGDVITDVAFSDLLACFYKEKLDGLMAVRLHEMHCPYGVVKTNGADFIEIQEKPVFQNQVNAGIYVLSPAIIKLIKENKHFNMTDLFIKAKSNGAKLNVFPLHEKWIDIGKHDDYLTAQHSITNQD
ncbi:nucleotidyl transferase [bacterium]|nr:nucleotidyl transferase [bacterium]|tara:strand:- start:2786 stop:3853 length:1068 start_codon:yes stop_codon:yes gene_type:complete